MRSSTITSRQDTALLDAEAVLLVNDDQTDVVVDDLARQEGMGSDDNSGRSRGDVGQGGSGPSRPHRTREQGNSGGVLWSVEATARGQLAHHPGDRGVMLLGENLGGCQQDGLVPGVDDLEHGA